AKERAGLIQKVNINTLRKEFLQLERAVRYEENHTYSRRDRHVIVKYIYRLPGLEGASTRQRSKPVALFADVSDIIYFMLCCDEYVWIHPREMIQTIWILELMGYWGVRPGEITESCGHRGSNEGILYEDCSLLPAAQPTSRTQGENVITEGFAVGSLSMPAATPPMYAWVSWSEYIFELVNEVFSGRRLLLVTSMVLPVLAMYVDDLKLRG
ncbi:hypothetical protein EJ04DRAFT_453255, partial [Polyplosphaeria fusca]